MADIEVTVVNKILNKLQQIDTIINRLENSASLNNSIKGIVGTMGNKLNEFPNN